MLKREDWSSLRLLPPQTHRQPTPQVTTPFITTTDVYSKKLSSYVENESLRFPILSLPFIIIQLI